MINNPTQWKLQQKWIKNSLWTQTNRKIHTVFKRLQLHCNRSTIP